MLEAYICWLCRWPKTIALGSVLIVLALSAGVGGLSFTNDTRAYFSEDNPQLAAFDTLESIYDKQDTVSFVVVAREGDIFTPQLLRLTWELTELGWQAPYSRRASSLANYQHTTAQDDDLYVADLIPDATSIDERQAAKIRSIALSEEELLDTVVARDGKATFVVVALSLPPDNIQANDEVARWAEQQLPILRTRYPSAEIHLTGTTTFNYALGKAVAQDLGTLVTLSYAVIVFLLIVLLRHLGGVVSTLIVVTLAISATMGTFGWFQAVLEAVSGFVPSVVMTIAVADCVHILTSYYYELRKGSAPRVAVADSLRINAVPVFITSITTTIGVLTLNFSDSPPYRDLGNMIALGVGFAFFLSMTFLPAFLLCTEVRHPERGQVLEVFMSRFASWVITHYKKLLSIGSVVIIAIASAIPNNELTERWHDYFDDTFEARRSLDAINQHMNWLQVIRYSVAAGRDHGINNPDFLAALERFAQWYESQPEVTRVSRITLTLKRLNKNLHADHTQYYRLPETAELTAQYLLLYEMSLPQGLGLENTINVTRSATQLVAHVHKMDSKDLLELDRKARQWANQYEPLLGLQEGSGLDMVFANINDRNIRGLLKGMVVAMVLISLLLVFALRSVKLGVLSLITNLAPAGLAYGTWGLVNGRIDLSAAVVICMSIGIVVDDTVHFLSKYLHARRRKALDTAQAMQYTFNTVGVALTTTTCVLVAGFLVLTASHFNPTVVTGTLLAMTLSYALLVDFLFMPPLLIALDRRTKSAAID